MDGQLQRTGATVAFDICGWPGTISSKIMRDSWTAVSLSLVVFVYQYPEGYWSDQYPEDTHPPQISGSLSLSVQLPPLQYSDLRTKGLGLLGFSAISLSQGTDQGPSRRNWRHSGLVSSPGFLSLIGRCLPLSWKLLFYMFCLVFLIVSDRRVILVPIISPWPEAEGQVRWYFIEYIWTPCWIIVTVFSPSRGYCCACSVVSHSLDCSLPVPLFMGVWGLQYWSGLLFPPPGDLPICNCYKNDF